MLSFANAKINLGLHVLEKRPDGYHNLETVFYPVKVFDVIELTDSPTGGTALGVHGAGIPGPATDNICLKAFAVLNKDFKLPPQQITLLKNIPVGAGLGGGSADAAFLVKLLNEKFSLGLSEAQMEDYVRPLGADCPFFIRNRPVYAAGKGDVFSDISIDLSGYFLALVKPGLHVSTAEAYHGIIPAIPSVPLKELIGLPVAKWRKNLKNDFEAPVFAKYPEIGQIRDHLYQKGAIYAAMSGSGSSVFGIFEKPIQLPELETSCGVFYDV